jgi:carboxymethylenebutenolidase
MKRADGNAIESGWVEIHGELRGYSARPKDAPAPYGVLLFIEAFGVNEHMRSLAQRYAQAGYAALVPDIYHGRTFGYEGDRDAMLGAIRALDERRVMNETARALEWLASSGIAGKPATVGFCLGGRLAFRAGIELGNRLSAVVAYYGGGIGPETDRFGRETLVERAVEFVPPLLLHYGAGDPSIGAEEHGRIATALSRAGKRYVMSVYPDAGHGFNCDARAGYDAVASAEAWDLTDRFLQRHFVR